MTPDEPKLDPCISMDSSHRQRLCLIFIMILIIYTYILVYYKNIKYHDVPFASMTTLTLSGGRKERDK